MDRRSQLMALAVVFGVAAALSPATARAADGCVANPTGAARSGMHWYYQTNEETEHKCWFLGARKTAARKIVQRSPFGLTDQDRRAEQMAAATCAVAPGGQPSRGARWSYQRDSTTGQKCWRLGGRIHRTAKAAPAELPAFARLAAAGEPSTVLPPSVADARASVEASVEASVQEQAPENVPAVDSSPAVPVVAVSSVPEAPEPAAQDEASILTFESRWPSEFNVAPAVIRPSLPNDALIDQQVAGGVGTRSFKDSGLILVASPPLIDILVVFVATLGSALILLGLLDWSFLFRGAESADLQNRSPLRLPKLDTPDSDSHVEGAAVSAARRDDMLALFAPLAAVPEAGNAPRLVVETA